MNLSCLLSSRSCWAMVYMRRIWVAPLSIYFKVNAPGSEIEPQLIT